MQISKLVEKYFWIFLLAAIIFGLWLPVPFATPKFLPKLILGMMLFFVFLKIDILDVFDKIRDYKLMIYISALYMLIIPILFYLAIQIFDKQLALGILLLTAMPAGVSTPALADILKGNIALATSIAVVTQVIAPFTVPLLFWIAGSKGLEIDKLNLFRDIAILVFLPLILAQFSKYYFPTMIKRNQHLLTSSNILLLFLFVYIVVSSQGNIILVNPISLIWKTAILYLVFLMLHFIGYISCYRKSKEDKIALSVTSAYMNNGLAIVLASAYFGSDILILMVLSEIPWNTLPAPFKRVAGYF